MRLNQVTDIDLECVTFDQFEIPGLCKARLQLRNQVAVELDRKDPAGPAYQL